MHINIMRIPANDEMPRIPGNLVSRYMSDQRAKVESYNTLTCLQNNDGTVFILR